MFLKIHMFEKFGKLTNVKFIFVLLVCFGLYIDALNVSIRVSVISVHMNIFENIFWDLSKKLKY